MLEPFEHHLTEKLTYASQGIEAHAEYIMLYPPTTKNMNEVGTLKQAFFRALPKNQTVSSEDVEKTKGEKLTGDEVMAMILASDVDVKIVLTTARELFTTGGVAKVNDEVKLTKPLCDAMEPDDFMNMVGEYLLNFILASVLQTTGKNS